MTGLLSVIIKGMPASATITVLSGPDTGREFGLNDELVHIGRGRDNQVVLSDAGLAEHQASIVRRQGRFAIYAPESGTVQVDGNEIPPERWVWLPRRATIRLGEQTVLQLESGSDAPPAVADSTPTPLSGRGRNVTSSRKSDSERARRRARNGEHRPQVARFLNDRAGEPLVRLGEDGQLPALELAELSEEQPRERREAASSNPWMLYGLMAASFALSLVMLVMEPGRRTTGETSAKAQARLTLQQFYGEPGALQPYQRLLRQALIDHSQGNSAAEREAYRRVLRLLNSSDIRDPRNLNGLTGAHTRRGRSSDDELRQALLTLLAD